MAKLPIPDKVWDAHVAILAKTGAGKSYLVQLVTEGHLAAGERVCLIDPMDRYWGLRMTAKGKPSPYDITIVGGDRGDIALRPDHGKSLAEIVGKSATNMIISTRKLSKDDRSQFAAEFFEHLLAVNQGILHLTIDECHLFAPQQGLKAGGFTPKMLSATQEIASGGRGVGLCMNFVSQRPAKLHNDVLSCAETLIAMRMLLPHDVEQVQNWIKHWATLDQGKEVLKSLGRLKTGEAWVWAPEMEILKRIEVPRISTFDSGAPGAAMSAPDLEPMDLDAITAKLKTAGEKIMADDPRHLKAEILRLKAEIAKKPATETVTVSTGLTNDDMDKAKAFGALQGEADERKRWLAAITALESSILQALEADHQQVRADLGLVFRAVKSDAARTDDTQGARAAFERAKAAAPRPLPPVPVRNARPAPLPKPAPNYARADAPAADLPLGELAVLKAVAQYPDGASREQLSVLTGYKKSSRNAYVSRLTSKGLLTANGDNVYPTEAGISALGSEYEPLPTGHALQEHWLRRLPDGEAAILSQLIKVYPRSIPRERLSDEAGYKKSSRNAYISRLSTKKLVFADGGEIRASDHLFG